MMERLCMSGVAVVVGALALVAACTNRDMFYQLPKVRLLESSWGRPAARVFFGIVGVFLILLAIFIVTDGRRLFVSGLGPRLSPADVRGPMPVASSAVTDR
jgi:hypothetical protein